MSIYGYILSKLKSIVSVEESAIYKGDGLCIGVFNDTGRNYSKESAYFKVYKGNSSNSDKCARITLINPSYVNHYKNNKDQNWELNSSEKTAS